LWSCFLRFPMNERRISPHRGMLKSGQIAFTDKAPKLECTVRNCSETGACLQISTTYGMPASFSLIIDGVHQSCRVVWRTETRLGVTFI
jgi:hypothetical protein